MTFIIILYFVGVILAASAMYALDFDSNEAFDLYITMFCFFSFFALFICLLLNFIMRATNDIPNKPKHWFDFKLLKI